MNPLDMISIAAMILFWTCWLIVAIRVIWKRFAPVKTVSAEVADKYKTYGLSRFSGAWKREHYIIVFSAGEKKLSFAVSEYSYQSYQLHDKGMLEYKGNHLISFQ